MRRLLFATSVLSLVGCGQTTETAEAPKTKEAVTAPVKTEEPNPIPPPVAAPLVIPVGTLLTVRTSTGISSETAIPGQGFSASLAEPVVIDGKTLVPKGAGARGVILSVDHGGRVKGVASLSLGLTNLRVGGKQVSIATEVYVKEAPATKKKDAVKVGIGAGIGAAVGAIVGGGKGAAVGAASGAGAGTAVVLATHGDPAVVEAESVLNFRLTKSVRVVQ